MQIIQSSLFQNFPEILFGFSTKIGLDRQAPFFFNLSLTVGDDNEKVFENREAFFNKIGLTTSQIAFQKQVHSDFVTIVDSPGIVGESDAIITYKKNIGIAISSADCTPIFIYDRKEKVIAGVHSGWRGTQKQILHKTLSLLTGQFNSMVENLFAYIGPSISQKSYEVGAEVANQFDAKFVKEFSGKYFLDVTGINLNTLLDFGLSALNLEVSPLCSFQEKNLLHSYRRDGVASGRSLGIIAMKGE